ncbi:MAG: MTH1187 family thiamine-binding protein [Candidatus Eisenbacteria bacterium]|nr:MTH1187 family thiamine-binding protein [Candidatus Eisenbacteria bacterium]
MSGPVLLDFSMSPVGAGVSVSPYVARVLNVIDGSGIDYRLHPMGTVLEGEWAEVLDVVTRCFEELRSDCERISVSIRIDYRRGGAGRLESKIESVERHLGRRLRR